MKARNAKTLPTKRTEASNAALSFDLARGESTGLTFVPSAHGYLRATATWSSDAENALALKMQLIRPDGSVAADAIGCNPMALHFHLRRNEFKRNQGNAYRVVLMHTVAALADDITKGELRVTWGDGVAEDSPTPAA